jgi:heme/copper-type cytochrome/quinol oxidase subunit 3
MINTRTTTGKLENIDNNTLGMALFLGSETVFFALLIIAYITFRNSVPDGPNASTSLDPLTTFIFSLALFSSSFTVWRADKALERRDHGRQIIWLVATIVLGLIFLIGQGTEYWRLLTDNVTVSRNIFGTTFFTLTGFHGLHVFIGLVMLAIVTGLTIAGHIKGPRAGALSAVSLYWHFVDAVWVFIFTIVYIGTAIIKF